MIALEVKPERVMLGKKAENPNTPYEMTKFGLFLYGAGKRTCNLHEVAPIRT